MLLSLSLSLPIFLGLFRLPVAFEECSFPLSIPEKRRKRGRFRQATSPALFQQKQTLYVNYHPVGLLPTSEERYVHIIHLRHHPSPCLLSHCFYVDFLPVFLKRCQRSMVLCCVCLLPFPSCSHTSPCYPIGFDPHPVRFLEVLH